MPSVAPTQAPRGSAPLSAASLVAAGCGTAIASVCAFGLFQIERLLGGIWSAAAVVVAGLLCAVLARAFARLSSVVPSGAGLLAYLSRGFGRRAGVVIAVPYLLLTLFLVGAEATIVGALFARVTGAPPLVGALSFVVGTWTLCRAGVRISHRAQSIATWTLIASLSALSIAMIARESSSGLLLARLAPPAPSPESFLAAVGQALFLFMGFELITSQAEAAEPTSIDRGLRLSVVVLTAFYALVSVGFSCAETATTKGESAAILPQIVMAERAGGEAAVLITAALSLLASFTSFNGALLAFSRFFAALASQGVLPKSLGKITPRGLVPDAALAALLACAVAFTALVGLADLLSSSVLAAAVSASIVYGGCLWASRRPPFSPPERALSTLASRYGALAIGLLLLGVGVIVDAGADRGATLAILGAAFAAALAASYRGLGSNVRRPARGRPSAAGPRLASAPGGARDR